MTESRERTTSNLLAFRDGEVVDAEVVRSLKDDPAQAAVLERLKTIQQDLQHMQPVAPDPEVWEAVQARVQMGNGGGRTTAPTLNSRHAPLALVAGLVIAVATALLVIDPAQQDLPPAELSAFYEQQPALSALYERSQQLEPLTQNARFGELGPSEQALHYRIADVDAQLSGYLDTSSGSQPDIEEIKRLWSQRVALLESLAEVRRNRAALQPAIF